MPYSIKFNESLRLVELVPSGALTSRNIVDGTDEFVALARKHDTNCILIDTSALESVDDLSSFYDQPKMYNDAGLVRTVRIALVVARNNEPNEALQFYENVCVNRGWAVKTFENRGDAIEWLEPSAPDPQLPVA